MSHLPAPGAVVPVSTYRVQLRPASADHPGFTFDDAAAVVGYLADLGVTHLYCSPWLQAAPGSAHGYDVVDHSRLNDELGEPAAFDRLVTACARAGLGIVLDIVPNHMATSEPESQNAQWWSVLRDGPASPYADWFDIDWGSPDNPGKILVPVLGGPLEQLLGELTLHGSPPDRIRYYGHELPIAAGTLVDGDIAATLERQHYVLCDWRLGGTSLNYRRFFDVTTLAGVRVEVPSVFDETHRLIAEQVREGIVGGLRVDHPDGLADPGGYLDRLAQETRGAWVVVEKILEPGERLPAHWACSGTTGYDVLNQVLGLFVDPAGEAPLTALWQAAVGDDTTYEGVVLAAKRQILTDVLGAEVTRLTRVAAAACAGDAQLAAVPEAHLRAALVAVLAGFGVYRAYLAPQGPADSTAREHVDRAVAVARRAEPSRAAEIDLIGRLALADGPTGPAAQEFVTRFQQTCGPVMAKGVEDTSFYRYLRLSGLNEVGGDPSRFGTSIAAFHEACTRMQADWPLSMTTLSTHDTKRSEDVRARLVLLSQCPQQWADAVTRWSKLAAPHRADGRPDAATEQLIWQTFVGAWPLTADRAVAYVEKATREAKVHTSWLTPDPAYEASVAGFVRAVLDDEAMTAEVTAFVDELAHAWRTTCLAQKLIQLTMPGVADTYQGTELFDLSLVDPDNRRAVDYDRRQALLAARTSEPMPLVDDGGAAKLHVVSTALRLRRAHPEWFLAGATYRPLDAGADVLAFTRSEHVVTVAPLRALELARWTADEIELPAGRWRNLLTDTAVGATRPADLLTDFPVALLVRDDA